MIVYLDNLKNNDRKYNWMREYLEEINKYNHPVALGMEHWLKINCGLGTESLQKYKHFFKELPNEKVSEVFAKFPLAYPKKLFFITAEVNDNIIFLNKATYTEFLGIEIESGRVNFLAFNAEKESVTFKKLKLINPVLFEAINICLN